MKADKIGATLRLAALLHDVGHGPFSHMSETFLNRLGIFPGGIHERMAVELIRSELRDPLDKISQMLNLSKRVALRKDELASELITALTKPHDLRHDIISGVLDVDRMDYIQRDSYYSGVVFGNIDIPLLLDSLHYDDSLRTFFIEGVDGIKAAEAFLLSRDQNYELVNYNPMSRFYVSLLERALVGSMRRAKFKNLRRLRMEFLRQALITARSKSEREEKVQTINRTIASNESVKLSSLRAEYLRVDDPTFWNEIFTCKDPVINIARKFITEKRTPRQIHVYWKDLSKVTQRNFLSEATDWQLYFLSRALESKLGDNKKGSRGLRVLVDVMRPSRASKDMFEVRPDKEHAYSRMAGEESLNLLDLPIPKSFYDRNKQYWRICVFVLDDRLGEVALKKSIRKEIVMGNLTKLFEDTLQTVIERELQDLEISS